MVTKTKSVTVSVTVARVVFKLTITELATNVLPTEGNIKIIQYLMNNVA